MTKAEAAAIIHQAAIKVADRRVRDEDGFALLLTEAGLLEILIELGLIKVEN